MMWPFHHHAWEPVGLMFLRITDEGGYLRTETVLDLVCTDCGRSTSDLLATHRMTHESINKIMRVRYGPDALQFTGEKEQA